jgi:hypothetical protein
MSSSLLLVVGLIAVIIVFSLVVALYQPVMGSVANDAIANNISNSSINGTYEQGTAVAVGFMGFDTAIIAIIIIILIIAVFSLLFVL